MYYIRKYSNGPIVGDEWIKDIDDIIKKGHCSESVNGLRPGKPLKQHDDRPPINVGMVNDTIIIEIDLAGYDPANITVTHTGFVITIEAKYNLQSIYPSSIEYLDKNIQSEDIKRHFYLSNDYADANVTWKSVNGMVIIAISKTGAQQTQIPEASSLFN